MCRGGGWVVVLRREGEGVGRNTLIIKDSPTHTHMAMLLRIIVKVPSHMRHTHTHIRVVVEFLEPRRKMKNTRETRRDGKPAARQSHIEGRKEERESGETKNMPRLL